MFPNSKTSSWLSQKSVQEREDFLKIARSKVSDLRKVYKLRSEEVFKKREDIVKQKQLAIEKKRHESAKMKEKLTKEIMGYSLWQN